MFGELLGKYAEMFINFLNYFPKAIVEWFDLTAADVLRLQYIALILPFVVFIFHKVISRVFKNVVSSLNSWLNTILKFMFIVLPIVFFFDEVLRQYWPLSLIKEWPSAADAVIIIDVALFGIEIGILLALLDFIFKLFDFICVLLFKKYKAKAKIFAEIDFMGRFATIYTYAILLLHNLCWLLNGIALALSAFVLYYNHCI